MEMREGGVDTQAELHTLCSCPQTDRKDGSEFDYLNAPVEWVGSGDLMGTHWWKGNTSHLGSNGRE